MSGPFTTRAAAQTWLREQHLEHLERVSAGVLAPHLSRYRLLDLASDESIARQTYSVVQLQPLELPAKVWQFFQAEAAARDEATHDVARRLSAPPDARCTELHRRLVALRRDFSDHLAAKPDRALDLARLTLEPERPGFTLADLHRWERPGQFGFIDPISTLNVGEPGSVTCTCGAPRCVHALALVDAALLWLRANGNEDEALALTRPLWARALGALGELAHQETRTSEPLTWRLDVDDYRLELTPYLGNRARPVERLAALLGRPLAAADAALAAHLEAGDPASALAAMVAHPRITLASNPNRAVTVTRTEVGLTAEDRGGTVLLTLGVDGTPLPEVLLERVREGRHREPLFLWDPGACRLEQLDLSPQVREAFAVLTRYGSTFPPEAQPALLEQLSALATRVPVAMPRSVLGESTPVAPAFVLRLELQPSHAVRAELRIRPLPESDAFLPGEGPKDVLVRRRGEAVHAVRRPEDERAAARALEAELPLRGAEPIADFVHELPDAGAALELLHACSRREEPLTYEWVGQPVLVLGAASARQLRVAVDKKREWFGVLGELSIYGERVKLALALDAARRQRRFVRVTEHSYLELSDMLLQQLVELDQHVQRRGHDLTLSASATAALTALAEAGASLDVDADFRALTERIAAAKVAKIAVPRALKAKLRDYQREGFEWLARLAAWGAGGVLADDMGLGKTVQALALLLYRAKLGPALVLAPTSVVFNWAEEAKRFAPTLKIHLRRPARALRAGDVLVSSYGLAVRDGGPLKTTRYATLVLDEAHALKNASTQRARAVRELDAEFVVGLTGTPVENHLGELWSLYRIVLPQLFGGWDQFRDRFAIPIEKRIDPSAPARLSNALQPFLLRRTKAFVAAELPPRTEVRVDVALSSEEWQLYEDARLAMLWELEASRREREEQQRRVEVLAGLTRLRLLASHPRLHDPSSTLRSAKLSRLLELVETLRASGQRALVFSQFTSHLDLVREALDAQRVRYQYLDGSTPERDRAAQVRAFQEGSDPLFLISLKAGGVGLNLTAADNVILLDPWWNPAVEDQAADRAHRLGQTRPVTVYRLVAMGTIEEKMLGLHETKRALVADVLAGTSQASRLKTAELLALLDPPGVSAASRPLRDP